MALLRRATSVEELVSSKLGGNCIKISSSSWPFRKALLKSKTSMGQLLRAAIARMVRRLESLATGANVSV